MNLTSYFTSSGVPATGKSPTISVWTVDGTKVVEDDNMVEIAGGFYTYDFTGYTSNNDYVIQSHESTLPTSEQYVIGSNDVDSQRNQGVIKQILGMVQSNFKMSNQSYDGDGNLESGIIHTYENASDTNSDSNRLHSYSITASYTNGQLTDYKVTDI